MDKPLPFLIENKGKLELNENLLKIIEKSKDPRLLLFYGGTRQGKSTTLNQIIRGNIDTWKYINRSPFESQTSQKSLTLGCDIFGPIKCSEIKRRHSLDIKLNEDFDIFFCDTEGLYSLNGTSKLLIPGILTLLQVCTLSVIMINTVPDDNTISQITSEIQFSKILQQINKDLQSPLVAVYISGYQIDLVNCTNFEECKQLYEDERDETIDVIYDYINKKYKNLKIKKKDFKVIPGGPYEHNYDKEPDHKDIKAQLYWDSIKDIVKQFIFHTNKTPNYNVSKLISLIRIVFDIFKSFTELPENIDLKNILIEYISKSFDDYSKEQFKKINEEIKNDLKNNYNKYYLMLNDNDVASSKLNNCIEENKIEIYKSLIPEKIQNFMENAMLKLRQSIEKQFEEEFNTQNKLITSKDYINKHIQNIVEEINKANFQEDINMTIVNDYNKIWNKIEKANEGLFIYFKEKKPTSLENMKKNFNNTVEKIINNLISQKKIWKTFFEEKKREIKEEINSQYLELFKNVQYQEDFIKLIKKNDKLSEELILKYNEKYFKKLQDVKKEEINKWIKQTCELEYKKLLEENSKKPKWENTLNKWNKIISERIERYIENKFNGKYFRNEIDPNLGRSDVISGEVLKDADEIQEFPPDKQKEIKMVINKNIANAIDLFNKKREKLPLLEEKIFNKEKICNQIADEKIKELLSKFTYSEDKIIFKEDNFYSLLKQNKKVNFNIPQNNVKFEEMIRKVSKNKSEEYNNILVPKKPSWNKKKDKIINNIKEVCENFIKKLFKNKSYKEDIKYDINILGKEIESLNLFKGIEEKKHDEIKKLINKIKEKTQNEVIKLKNNLPNWSEIKNLEVNKGKEIMFLKLESNIETKDINQLINILLEEVKNYPKFCDPLKDKERFDQVFTELKKFAEDIGQNHIAKKIKDEKEKQANVDTINQLKTQIDEGKQTIDHLKNEIKNITTIKQPIQPQVACFQRPNYNGCSIVDALKSIGANSSYNYRATIASRNGITGYVGSPEQNTYMLNLLKQGKLVIP